MLQYDKNVLRRLINVIGFLACAGMLGYAFFAQYHLGLQPCPLCWLQRVGVFLMGLIFLIALLHNPKGWGARVYAVLIALASLLTVGIAARHVYVQHMPAGSLPSCGAPLEYLIRITPFAKMGQLLEKVLAGSGECSTINWHFLSLTMPEWVLIAAFVVGLWGVLGNLLAGPHRELSLPTAGGEQRV